jgi:hypothetical protein
MPGLSETEALSFLLLKQFASRLLPSSIEDDLEFYFKNASQALSENISKVRSGHGLQGAYCRNQHSPTKAEK